MQKHSFEFTGCGREYFKIWIVNLLLTIVTLGIYSAWAKVRRNQYFYRNTYFAGASFDYHALPITILKGRIVALILFTAYSQSIRISTTLYFMMLGVVMLVLPFLIQRSLSFKLHNSSYRGLRFKFAGDVAGAYKVFLIWPILTLFTLYMLVPFTHQRMKKYQHNNSLFGQTPFSFHAPIADFYLIYVIAFICITGLGVLAGVSVAVLGLGGLMGASMGYEKMIAIVVVVYAVLIIAGLFIAPYFNSRLQNLIWNKTQLGEHHFNSRLQAKKLLFIYVTNVLGVVFTLGLYQPFASVRLLKYRLENLTLEVNGDLQTFVASQQADMGATGEGASDIFDIDISL